MAKLTCQRCGGLASGSRGCLILSLIFLTFPFGLVLLLMPVTYRCKRCGNVFK